MRKILGPDILSQYVLCMTNIILLDSYGLFEHFVLVWLLYNIFLFYIYTRAITRLT